MRLYARREEIDEPAESNTEEDEKDKDKQELEAIESDQLKRLARKEGRGDLAGT